MIKVFVIDQQSLFRNGIRSSLTQMTDIEILGEANVNEGALSTFDILPPDVVLMDIDIPSLGGLRLCRAIKQRLPSVAVIILTPQPQDDELFEAIKYHASAYLSKEVDAHELARTIRQCAQGEHPINESLVGRPSLAKQVLDQFYELSREREAAFFISPLTPRETEVLNYMAEGYLNKQIAELLSVSEQTIKNHITSILRKLNANARTQAVVIAIKRGLVSITKE